MGSIQQSAKSKPIKKANDIIFFILKIVFVPALYLLYRFRFDKKSSKGITRPCLILSNHQTVLDQFLMCMGFNFGINFVASNSTFRHGLLSKIMIALVRPIPFAKGSSDMSAIRNMISVIRDGGSVGMFPSGNRSFFGDECTIVPGIGKLAKKFKAPLVLMQVRGGFNTKPRWSAAINKGKLSAHVTRVLSIEELTALNADEIEKIIRSEICFDEFEYNKTAQVKYNGKRKAEYLESVLFYCPSCSCMNTLESKRNSIFCKECGSQATINTYGFFEKDEKRKSIPDTILEWGNLQLEYIKQFDFSSFTDNAVFSDDNIIFSQAEHAKKETQLGKGRIEFFTDKIIVCGHSFYFTDATMAIHGVYKMTIYSKDGVYTIVAPKKTNLAKYMICGYHLRNKILGNGEEFYGY
jgi:1-acyl-sn-glycerol-3-phosphate acyltransferase